MFVLKKKFNFSNFFFFLWLVNGRFLLRKKDSYLRGENIIFYYVFFLFDYGLF